MIEMGHGSIINIGSGVSVLGDLFNPAYSTSKGAVNTLTRNVAARLANEAFDAMPFFRALFLPHTQQKGCPIRSSTCWSAIHSRHGLALLLISQKLSFPSHRMHPALSLGIVWRFLGDMGRGGDRRKGV